EQLEDGEVTSSEQAEQQAIRESQQVIPKAHSRRKQQVPLPTVSVNNENNQNGGQPQGETYVMKDLRNRLAGGQGTTRRTRLQACTRAGQLDGAQSAEVSTTTPEPQHRVPSRKAKKR